MTTQEKNILQENQNNTENQNNIEPKVDNVSEEKTEQKLEELSEKLLKNYETYLNYDSIKTTIFDFKKRKIKKDWKEKVKQEQKELLKQVNNFGAAKKKKLDNMLKEEWLSLEKYYNFSNNSKKNIKKEVIKTIEDNSERTVLKTWQHIQKIWLKSFEHTKNIWQKIWKKIVSKDPWVIENYANKRSEELFKKIEELQNKRDDTNFTMLFIDTVLITLFVFYIFYHYNILETFLLFK